MVDAHRRDGFRRLGLHRPLRGASAWPASGTWCASAVRDTEAALFLKPMGAVGQIVPLRTPVTRARRGGARGRRRRCAWSTSSASSPSAEPAISGACMAEGAGIVGARRGGGGGRRGSCTSRPSAPIRRARVPMRAPRARARQPCSPAFPAAMILRPSIVFGPEDGFFNRFGAMARMSPCDAGDRRGHAVAARLCRRRGRRGHRRADRRRGGRHEVSNSAGRGSGASASCWPGSCERSAAGGGWSTVPPALALLQATPAGAVARQVVNPRPAAAAGARQRGGAGDRRAWPSWA